MSAIPLIRADFGPPPPEVITPEVSEPDTTLRTDLGNYIRDCFLASKQHRHNLGVEETMLEALRAMRGEYDPQTQREIQEFGGSKVYARIVASKVRGTSALLREIYTATERPWALNPTPEPSLAGPGMNEVATQVLQAEVTEAAAAGADLSEEQLFARLQELRELIQQQRKKAATSALRTREHVLDDLLWEGGFYNALWDMLGDIATFPFAVMKGPVVRQKNVVVWEGRTPVVQRQPTPHWERCSPFDVYFAPWAQSAQEGYTIHRERITRSTLEALKGLQTYDEAAIQRVLDNWGTSDTSWYDYLEHDRADLEQRESATNTGGGRADDRPKAMLSFYGPISTDVLRDWGVDGSVLEGAEGESEINVFAYLVGEEVIGVTRNPHPAGHKPFYVDSFERVPGSVYGNGIPALIADVQAVGNAALRAMVNNLAIASGPMAWVNEDRLAANDPNSTKLWPWKVFRFIDPATSTNSEEPMKFFQPNNNVEQLFNVYQQMLNMADEITTLPRYMQGSGQGVGGAGRTAAGLSMLMEASNRTIKQTVSSIDANIIEPVIEHLNIFLALTRSDVVVEGDISVVARGAAELMQRETMRMRRLEFLNITANPIDSQLVGIEGRYNVIKEIARDLNMPMSDTMPIDQKMIQAIQNAQLAQVMGQAGVAPPGAPGPQGGPPQGPPPGAPPGNPTQGIARPQTNSPT